jgi:hypothetical protein
MSALPAKAGIRTGDQHQDIPQISGRCCFVVTPLKRE